MVMHYPNYGCPVFAEMRGVLPVPVMLSEPPHSCYGRLMNERGHEPFMRIRSVTSHVKTRRWSPPLFCAPMEENTKNVRFSGWKEIANHMFLEKAPLPPAALLWS